MSSVSESPNRLAESIVAFCRYARFRGIPLGMKQTLAALRATDIVGVSDWQRFSFALRATLCSSHEQWEAFARIFDGYWTGWQRGASVDSAGAVDRRAKTNGKDNSHVLMAVENEDGASSADREGRLVAGASSQQRLKKIDFSEASQDDLAVLEQLSLRLLRQMSIRLSRRLRIYSEGNRVDLRRSIRRNISRGGDPINLAYKDRKPRKKHLVVFLDISGSMNLYSLFLLRFAYALQKHFKRVNTFLFSTGVVEVSSLLRAPTLAEALRGVSDRAPEWAGGTRIGASLRDFNRGAARKILSRSTTFIILSDGWDTGAPEVLAAELRISRSRVQRLLWLNPLLGLKDYRPITRGMSAALPYIDVFAPAHNLESLLALEQHF